MNVLRTTYNTLRDILPQSFIPSYDELKGIVMLSWPFIEYGLVHGFIGTAVAVCFCMDEVSRKGASDELDVSLLCATNEDELLDIVIQRVSDNERNNGNIPCQWMHVLLWMCCLREDDTDELLDWVDIIYAEFGYPKEIAPFVRYMPAKGRPKTPDELVKSLRNYLDKWKADVSSQSQEYQKSTEEECI